MPEARASSCCSTLHRGRLARQCGPSLASSGRGLEEELLVFDLTGANAPAAPPYYEAKLRLHEVQLVRQHLDPAPRMLISLA